MATEPPAVSLKAVEAGSGRKAYVRRWRKSTKRPQVLTTPAGSLQPREVGPAAALPRDAGSRQLGWEPFVLRGGPPKTSSL